MRFDIVHTQSGANFDLKLPTKFIKWDNQKPSSDLSIHSKNRHLSSELEILPLDHSRVQWYLEMSSESILCQ